MADHDPNLNRQSTGRATPGLFLLGLAVLFGLTMGAAGFLAGRATASTAPQPEPAALVSNTTLPPPPTVEPPTVEQPTVAPPTVAPPTVAPTPTAPPTQPPTAVPDTAVPVPTAAPTAEPPTPVPPDANISADSPLQGADFTTFYEVWDAVRDQYDGEMPPSGEVIESAIAGSLETLDDEYTRYVPPIIAERMRQDMDGSVEGIGAFVRENEEGLFEIVRPIDGQPADLAGLKAGDVLIEVDGQSVLDFTFDEVILMVRGPEGTSVNLKVMREGEAEPLDFTIVRTRFEVPTVESSMLPAEITGGAPIGYIRLTEFNRNAEERVLEALNELLAQQPVGLVFDLRDNPGGFLDQAVAVSDVFLPQGVALFERNIRGLDETFRTDDGDLAETIPLVVLVNAGSASASEIVAGAIQDRGRATLVGETTFGKGSVQQITTLSDGAELRVTVARWYTPNDNTIDGVGIVPNIEVETPEDLGGVEDGQLRRAVEYLLNGQ